MKRWIAVILGVLLLFTQGCARGERFQLNERPFGDTAFSAEIRGVRDGNDFSAKIGVVPVEGDVMIRIEYTAPKTLAGIAVEARCDGNGCVQGEAEIVRSGVSARLDAESLEGLLAPVSCLLELSEHTAVKKEDTTYELHFQNGEILCLDETGGLISYSDSCLQYDVIWLERRQSS